MNTKKSENKKNIQVQKSELSGISDWRTGSKVTSLNPHLG